MSKKGLALISFLVFALDQISKQLAERFLELHEPVQVLPGFFNLTLTYNRGIAFGLLSDLSENMRVLLLVGVTSLILFFVVRYLWAQYQGNPLALLALAFILGGAIGNLLDRAFLGYVVDFIDFYYDAYHWPAFNIADSAICVGVFLLVLSDISLSKSKTKE